LEKDNVSRANRLTNVRIVRFFLSMCDVHIVQRSDTPRIPSTVGCNHVRRGVPAGLLGVRVVLDDLTVVDATAESVVDGSGKWKNSIFTVCVKGEM